MYCQVVDTRALFSKITAAEAPFALLLTLLIYVLTPVRVTSVLDLVVFLVLLLVCAGLHELLHYVALRLLGYRSRLRVLGPGVVIDLVDTAITGRHVVITALAPQLLVPPLLAALCFTGYAVILYVVLTLVLASFGDFYIAIRAAKSSLVVKLGSCKYLMCRES